ncbi:LOW QUALITY PROTEIN: signal-induced proliferation-associated protein 1-like, partial [Cyanocitta cristata]
RPPEEGGVPGGGVPPRRTQSHEEAAGGASPTSPRFRDPLLLLGLAAGGGGPRVLPPPPPGAPSLAHYDVQSILFDPTEPPPGPPSLTSGASAAHLEPEEPPGSPRAAPDPEALVLSCPRFCCETGGEQEPGLGSPQGPPGPGQLPNAAVAVLEEPPAGSRPPHPIEHSDEGAEYYRKYFYGKGELGEGGNGGRRSTTTCWVRTPRLGPVAVSLRREEKEGPRPQVLHRIIVRTCQLRTLRGSVLEEALPPGCRPPGARGVPPRKLLELLLPGLALGGLRLAPSPAVQETLLKLDEQGVSRQRKVGVLYCRAGQGSEEEMYNNEGPGPAFEQFLALLGTRVRLRGFDGYRAQLDTRTDSTGTHSLYTTYHGYEVMFHVSTMLPFTPRNSQQLLRKRHIGNDIVTIVFQEPGARPFSPRALRSHFQHIFLVVRVHEPCTPKTTYRGGGVPHERGSGAAGGDPPRSGRRWRRGSDFWGARGLRPFLLAKAINGENAAARGGRLGAMAARTRRQYLQELLRAHGGGAPLPAPPRGLPALGGRRRGGSSSSGGSGGAGGGGGGVGVGGARPRGGPGGAELPCLLGVAAERVVVVAAPRGAVADRCGGVAANSGKTPRHQGRGRATSRGASPNSGALPAHPGEPPHNPGEVAAPPGGSRLSGGDGRHPARDAVQLRLPGRAGLGLLRGAPGDLPWGGRVVGAAAAPRRGPQVVARLQAVTRGCEAQEPGAAAGGRGSPGLPRGPSGVVTAVTRFSFAETAGLRPGTRLLRVGALPPPPRGPPEAAGAAPAPLGTPDPCCPRPATGGPGGVSRSSTPARWSRVGPRGGTSALGTPAGTSGTPAATRGVTATRGRPGGARGGCPPTPCGSCRRWRWTRRAPPSPPAPQPGDPREPERTRPQPCCRGPGTPRRTSGTSSPAWPRPAVGSWRPSPGGGINSGSSPTSGSSRA